MTLTSIAVCLRHFVGHGKETFALSGMSSVKKQAPNAIDLLADLQISNPLSIIFFKN